MDEIAKQLGISKKTAHKLVHEQHFHFVRACRAIRVSKESFDNWLQQ